MESKIDFLKYETNQRSNKLIKIIDNGLKTVLELDNCYIYCYTGKYNKESISSEKAWKTVKEKESFVIDKLKDMNYLISIIEVNKGLENEYPNLHIVIGSPLSIKKEEIEKRLNGIFDISYIGTKTRCKGIKADLENPTGILKYVLRNTRHKLAYDKLKFPPCTFFSLYENSYMNDFLYLMKNIIYVQNVKQQSNLKLINEFNKKNFKPKISGVEIIKLYMLDNKLVISDDGDFYQKVYNSKNTYKFYCAIQDFYKLHIALLKNKYADNDMSIINKLSKTLYDNKYYDIQLTSTFRENMDSDKIYDIPYKKILDDCAELDDCYINIVNGLINDKPEFGCLHFFPEYNKLTLEDFFFKIEKEMKPLSDILKNSGLDQCKPILNMLTNILLNPKKLKHNIILVGEKNSGKTSILKLIKKIIDNEVVMISNNKFKVSHFLDKKCLILDDFNGNISKEKINSILYNSNVIIKKRNQKSCEKKVDIKLIIACKDLEWAKNYNKLENDHDYEIIIDKCEGSKNVEKKVIFTIDEEIFKNFIIIYMQPMSITNSSFENMLKLDYKLLKFFTLFAIIIISSKIEDDDYLTQNCIIK